MSDHHVNSSDFAWLAEHAPEVTKQYSGKWIAVHNGRVVGVGDTATEAAAQARREDPQAQFILEAVTDNADVIYVDL